MDWNKYIGTPGKDFKMLKVDVQGRSPFRVKALTTAQYLNKKAIKHPKYSTRVIREYLRQLVGPELFAEISKVFNGQGNVNQSEVDDLLIKIRMFTFFNDQGEL